MAPWIDSASAVYVAVLTAPTSRSAIVGSAPSATAEWPSGTVALSSVVGSLAVAVVGMMSKAGACSPAAAWLSSISSSTPCACAEAGSAARIRIKRAVVGIVMKEGPSASPENAADAIFHLTLLLELTCVQLKSRLASLRYRRVKY